jgi:hypothetical protein
VRFFTVLRMCIFVLLLDLHTYPIFIDLQRPVFRDTQHTFPWVILASECASQAISFVEIMLGCQGFLVF